MQINNGVITQTRATKNKHCMTISKRQPAGFTLHTLLRRKNESYVICGSIIFFWTPFRF